MSKLDKTMEKLQHSCRDVCSGWKDGYTIGYKSMSIISERWREKYYDKCTELNLVEAEIEKLVKLNNEMVKRELSSLKTKTT